MARLEAWVAAPSTPDSTYQAHGQAFTVQVCAKHHRPEVNMMYLWMGLPRRQDRLLVPRGGTAQHSTAQHSTAQHSTAAAELK